MKHKIYLANPFKGSAIDLKMKCLTSVLVARIAYFLVWILTNGFVGLIVFLATTKKM